MTNKDESPGDSRLAALLAVHLVRTVLDEAYIIANAAKESGEPLSYLLKNLRNMNNNTKLDHTAIDDVTFTAKDNSEYYNGKNEPGNVIVTSTPQKDIIAAEKSKVETSCYIGQGDECYESQQDDLNKSTSVLINHLFDISDVERIIICDDVERIQNGQKNIETLQEGCHKISNSYVNVAHHILSSHSSPAKIVELNDNNSSYSILEDACASCNKTKKEVETFYSHDSTSENIVGWDGHTITESNQESPEETPIDNNSITKTTKTENNDVYEYAYLTLNRDDEQSEEAYPDVQDSKALQEIDLGSPHNSEGDLIAKLKTEEDIKLKATSFTTSVSRKSSLAHRCRHHGARFFSCLRGWWKRKSPGKRKELRVPGAARGFYLLSPGQKRKSASLISQRKLDSPTSSRPEVWKFNTLDESTVKACKWREYSFETKPDDPQ